MMQEKLESFGGRTVDAAVLRLTGTISELVGQLDPEEELFIVAKAVVGHIDHGNRGSGDERSYTRTHKANLVRLFVLPRDQGERMLIEAKELADERFGIQSLGLFDDKDDGDGEDDAGQ
jgi:hypothetical protein